MREWDVPFVSPLLSGVTQSAQALVDWVLPPRCPSCGVTVQADHQFCVACWQQLAFIGDPQCATCGRPFGETRDGEDLICAPCMADPPRHDGMICATIYNDASRDLVLQFKHGGRVGHAQLLARLMLPGVRRRLEAVGQGPWLVVPVPLHRWRLWRRSYNQAGLLARELADGLNATLSVDALQRTRATPMLKGRGRRERARILSAAIRANPARLAQVKGAHILLVDDVHTSGATTGTCTRVLKRAGAQRVVVACWARVLREGEEAASAEFPEILADEETSPLDYHSQSGT